MKRYDKPCRGSGSGRRQQTGQGRKKAEELKDPEKLYRELEQYRESGAQIMLSGKCCYPQTVVDACLREGCVYMPDYLCDEQDKIRGIDFIRVLGD